MSQHEGAEDRHVDSARLLGAALAPGEQLQIGLVEPVPDLLYPFDINVEGVGEGLLGKTRADPDTKLPGSEFEQGEAAGGIEVV